jgi:hypothetical protein
VRFHDIVPRPLPARRPRLAPHYQGNGEPSTVRCIGGKETVVLGLVRPRCDPHLPRLVFGEGSRASRHMRDIRRFPDIAGSADLFPGYWKKNPDYPATGIRRQASELSRFFRDESGLKRAESANSRLFSRFMGICPRSAPAPRPRFPPGGAGLARRDPVDDAFADHDHRCVGAA